MPDSVSVVIPTHNYARFVGDAIDSVLAQQHRPIDVIVVDDGSTDNTPAVLDRYRGRVRTIRLEGEGVSRARNAGLAAAIGDHVVFLDADDLILPDGLAAQAGVLAVRPDIDAVYGRWYVCHTENRAYFLAASPIASGDLFPRILAGNVVTTPSAMMVRRRAVEAAGGFSPDVSFTADWELWTRLAVRGHRFAAIPEAVAIYRVHGRSMTQNVARAARDVDIVLERYGRDASLQEQLGEWLPRAHFAMNLYVGKLFLEAGNTGDAASRLRRALAARPQAADDPVFYYEIMRAMWWRVRGNGEWRRDAARALDAMQQYTVSLAATNDSPDAAARRGRAAIIQLAAGLVARRAGSYSLALRRLWAAFQISPSSAMAPRHVGIVARLCLPVSAAATVKRMLGVFRRAPSSGTVPPLVASVLSQAGSESYTRPRRVERETS